MSRRIAVLMVILCVGCSQSNNDESPTPDAGDVAADMTPSDPDAEGADVGVDMNEATFCSTADCSGDTPVCSELLEACVECASDNDCGTAPLLTCETQGVDGGDPSFTCVECIDDSVCAGGTCDLESHTCV